MKLILDLKDVDVSHFGGYYPRTDVVTLRHFPEHIQKAARFASLVEYRDGSVIKVLKDRNNTIREGSSESDINHALQILQKSNKFRRNQIDIDAQGFSRILFERY